MIKFLNSDLWTRLAQLSRKASRQHVAVAYLARGASKLLQLAEGDVLVVDMSDASVKTGRTDPEEVLTYLGLGVRVFSVENLHAKVFVLDKSVVVGSANVSKNSRDALVEAAIETTNAVLRVKVLTWIKSIALAPVTPKLAAAKAKIYNPPTWSIAKKRGGAGDAGVTVGRLWLVNTQPTALPEDEQAILNRQAAGAKRRLTDPARYAVETVRYHAGSRFARQARIGHIVIEIHRDGNTVDVYPPARVVYARSYNAAGKTRVGVHMERRKTARPYYWGEFRKAARVAGVKVTKNTEREIRDPSVQGSLLKFFG